MLTICATCGASHPGKIIDPRCPFCNTKNQATIVFPDLAEALIEDIKKNGPRRAAMVLKVQQVKKQLAEADPKEMDSIIDALGLLPTDTEHDRMMKIHRWVVKCLEGLELN